MKKFVCLPYGRMITYCILSVFVSGILASCKTPEEAKKRMILFDKNPAFLFEKLHAGDFQFSWLTAKYSAEVEMDGKNNSFKASLRAKKDSVIWISIMPALGIEAARVKITTDSVFFINRLNSTYFKGDFQYINKLINTETDFKMFQALLFGIHYTEFNEAEFKSAVDNGRYLLSNLRKRKLKRTIQRNDSLNLEAQSIWLEPENFKICKYRFNDFNTLRELEVNYGNFNLVGDKLFPFNLVIGLDGDKKASIKINYSKVVQDGPQSFPFTIPEKYEQIY